MQKNGQGNYQFDIKETLNLSHEQIPIEEIEDMELVQKIECKELGENIEISGSLILIGNYKGNQDAGKLEPTDELPDSFEESVLFEPLATETGPFSPLTKRDQLKRQIPIQITLPREKVIDIDEIYTYVSSFDYEVKTPYQMEITASLIIGGLIDKEETMERKDSKWDQFEFVYTSGQSNSHSMDAQKDPLQWFEEQATGKENSNPSDLRDDAELNRADESERNIERQEKEAWTTSFVEEEDAESGSEAENEREEEASLQDQQEAGVDREQTEDAEPAFSADAEEEQDAEREDNVIPIPHLADAQSPVSEDDRENKDQDVRVAITNKQTQGEKSEPLPSLSSFFARKERSMSEEASADAGEEEAIRPEDGNESDSQEENDAAYLGNFLDDESEQFTKVKICIIQKDETIDEIAERYELTVDAILRSNGTARNQVAPGQLLYIPVKG